MKLSDIKGESVIDVIADLVVPVANIATDKEASEMFSRKPLPAGMTKGQFMAQRIKQSIPKLLKGHKEDVVLILATIAQEDVKEYESSLTIPKLINDAVELVSDDVFQQFFFSAQTAEPAEPSGSAPESTEGDQQQAS